ncbi:MAG: ABC transporter ATP-binding protein [Thermoprotei archaeon]|nr:MAG: ABC transporter ATP-binding protein [Thermoprotei archaeon]
MQITSLNGILFENVTKSFDEIKVLDNISLKIPPGKLYVLLGPNGSGKSTLMKMTIGLVKPDYGKVLVGGVNPQENQVSAKKIVGFLPEEPVLYESLELLDYLSFILNIYGINVTEERIREVLDFLGLSEHLNKLVGSLSHGNKRKLMLATLILRDPDYLVLDEVFSGLDPSSAVLVKAWLKEKIKRGATVVFSTHILSLAEALADTVVMIYKGKKVVEGSVDELRELYGKEELEEIFLSVTGLEREYDEIVRSLMG